MNDDAGATGPPQPDRDGIAPDGDSAAGRSPEAGDLGHPGVIHALEAVAERLTRLERSVPVELRNLPKQVEKGAVPAWRRVTAGEPRWQVSLAVVAAIALQLPVPGRLALVRPTWLLPLLEALLLAGLVIANPRRINRDSAILRYVALTLIALISLTNIWSVARLTDVLITRSLTGGAN